MQPRRIVPIHRSAMALARGARNGVRTRQDKPDRRISSRQEPLRPGSLHREEVGSKLLLDVPDG